MGSEEIQNNRKNNFSAKATPLFGILYWEKI
jgi:hypothetical protein